MTSGRSETIGANPVARRVLFLAPWVPSTRRPRSLGILQLLRESFDVRVICLAWSDADLEDASRLGAGTTVVRGHRLFALLRAAMAIASRKSLQSAYVASPRVEQEVKGAIESFKPDLVFLNVVRSCDWLRYIDSAPVVFDLDELRSKYYRQVIRSSAGPLERTVARIEAGRMERAEKAVISRAECVLVSSPVDLSLRGLHGSVELFRSLHAMGDYEWCDRGKPEILFVGRLGYSANIRGITWFVERVMPRVWARVPEATVRIVGSDSDERTRRLAGPRVDVVGEVPDVGVEYRDARLAVSPIFEATGVQMKLIEAAAVGTPMVVTPRCSALAAGGSSEVWPVADDEESWAEEVVALMTDSGHRMGISQRSLAWYESNYSRAMQQAALANLVNRTVRLVGMVER